MLSVGQILKKAREEKDLKLLDVEKEIRIREKFLQAVEDDNWDFFSSKVYINGIIKNYSRFLGLDEGKMLAFFRRDYEKGEEVKFKTKVASKYLVPETKKLIKFGFIIIFLIFFIYFSYQLRLSFLPPTLTVISPKQEVFKKEQKIKIEAKTDIEAEINIFGQRVYQDKNGVFQYELPLKKGKNELIIEIIGTNGKKAIIKKTYYLE